MVGLSRCVPVSVSFSDLHKYWGGECDGHIYGTSAPQWSVQIC